MIIELIMGFVYYFSISIFPCYFSGNAFNQFKKN